jgi:predicted NBD/HSP70 family sugar kinase
LRARIAGTPSASPEDARRTNRSLVLRALHLGGPTSRAELAKLISVTPATVSSVVRDLLADGLVEELGRTTARTVGKPATMVGIRPDGRHVAAIDLSSDHQVAGAIVDLNGKVLIRSGRDRADAVGDSLIAVVVDLCDELCGLAGAPLLGIGIATPGYVEPSGIIGTATRLHWTGVDLAAEIGGDVPVHVVNDANASALAELTFGDGDNRDLVVIRVDEGVGTGLVLDGVLHVGRSGGGGELGHVVIDPQGPPCECGKRGCLETFVSAPLAARRDRAGDAVAVDALLVEAGAALGRGVAILLSALDVGDVIVSGAVDVVDEPFLAAVRDAVAARTLTDFADRLDVRPTSFLDADVLLGAAALVLDRELGIR